MYLYFWQKYRISC